MFRLSWKRCVLAACVVTLLGLGVAAFVPIHAAPPDTTPNRFNVHEWGTFTSFAGSDGQVLSFTPSAEDLPAFVYRGGQDQVGPKQQVQSLDLGGKRFIPNVLISLETPVLYFYADRELTASVDVVFPK